MTGHHADMEAHREHDAEMREPHRLAAQMAQWCEEIACKHEQIGREVEVPAMVEGAETRRVYTHEDYEAHVRHMAPIIRRAAEVLERCARP